MKELSKSLYFNIKKKIREINEIQVGKCRQDANLKRKVGDDGFLVCQRREKAGIFFSDCSTG